MMRLSVSRSFLASLIVLSLSCTAVAAPKKATERQKEARTTTDREFELAAKLSYFLWNGPPDERLLQRGGRERITRLLRFAPLQSAEP